MRNTHVVRRQTIELTLPDRAGAHGVQEDVRQVARAKLVSAIGEVFSSLVREDEVVHLERVEVELGAISSDRLEEELLSRIRARLREIVGAELTRLRSGPEGPPRGRILGAEASKLQILAFFLETGALPWWCPRSIGLEAMVDEVLAESPADLVLVLRGARDKRRVARRLSRQVPLATWRRVLLLLLESAVQVEVLEEWVRILEALDEGFRPTRESAHLESLVGETFLTAALAPAHPSLSTTVLSEALVERLAAETGRSFEHAFYTLSSVAQKTLPATSAVGLSLAKIGRDRRGGRPAATEDAKTKTEAATREARTKTESLPTEALFSLEPAQERAHSGDAQVLCEKEEVMIAPGPKPLHAPEESAIARAPGSFGEDFASAAAEGFYVENAGLVLLWPYLTRFFRNVGLVERESFRSEVARERGVLLLQYLVTGSAEWPEQHLALNKVLCGHPLFEPVAAGIALTDVERREAADLLESVIANWTVLKNTSVDGLQKSFLAREGHLRSIDGEREWKLKVGRAGYDVLLDSLPWGIRFVLLPWMEGPLEVEW